MIGRRMSSTSNVKISRRGYEYGVVHFESPIDGELKDIVGKYLEMPPEKYRELLELGSIYLNDQRVRSECLVKVKDYLRVHSNPRRYQVQKVIYPDLILEEAEEYVVVHKPCGLPVHASVDNLQENLLYELSKKMNIDLKITNRLDVATEGLLLFAKTPEFQTKFNEYLVQGRVQKTYRAIVHSMKPLTLGRKVHYMQPSPRAPKVVSSEFKEGWQECVLDVLEVNPIGAESTEVFINLITGRTHQIRAQLSALGNPIIGDCQYGSSIRLSESSEEIKLQSYCLRFPEEKIYNLTDSKLFRK